MKKSIGIIGQFPLPMHGLSKALDTLYNSYLAEEFNLKKIDIKNNNKFIINVIKILFSRLDLYYLTISQSKFGNIRDLILIKLIQLKKRKIIIHLHGGGFRNILDNEFGNFQKKLNYKILSKVDGGIVLGKSLKWIFEGIIPVDKIHIVKNCVDNEFILNEEEFNKKMKLLEDKEIFKILYLSNFIEDKGYKEVLNLAKLVRERKETKYKFIFAGKFFCEEDKEEFLNFIEKNKLNDLIEYKGIVGGNEKLELFKQSDFFILLTKYKNEGQPISIIEAVANGLQIITTNHAGILDILEKNKMIVFEKNDLDTKKILNEININNINVKTDELRENREIMIRRFSEKEYLKKLDSILKNI